MAQVRGSIDPLPAAGTRFIPLRLSERAGRNRKMRSQGGSMTETSELPPILLSNLYVGKIFGVGFLVANASARPSGQGSHLPHLVLDYRMHWWVRSRLASALSYHPRSLCATNPSVLEMYFASRLLCRRWLFDERARRELVTRRYLIKDLSATWLFWSGLLTAASVEHQRGYRRRAPKYKIPTFEHG